MSAMHFGDKSVKRAEIDKAGPVQLCGDRPLVQSSGAGSYSFQAVAVPTGSLKKVGEVLCFGVGGGSEKRLDAEDFLERFQCGAVVVVNGIAVSLLPTALSKRRKQEHANWSIAEFPAVFGLVPDDEQGATFLVLV